MKSKIDDLQKEIVQDVDYDFVGIHEEPGWAIQLLTGKYKGIVSRYDNIKLAPDTKSIEPDDLTLEFGFTILEATNVPEDIDENDLGQYLGDVLMVAIQTGLQDGTAQINERESKQDYPTITLDE